MYHPSIADTRPLHGRGQDLAVTHVLDKAPQCHNPYDTDHSDMSVSFHKPYSYHAVLAQMLVTQVMLLMYS